MRQVERVGDKHLLSTYSSSCFWVTTAYNYGLWQRSESGQPWGGADGGDKAQQKRIVEEYKKVVFEFVLRGSLL
jgi:hypothetical protein